MVDPNPQQPTLASWFVAVGMVRRRIAGPLVFGALLVFLVCKAALLASMARISADISFPEGAIAERALAGARGAPIYEDWRQWPHRFSPYAPLTYCVPAAAARALRGEHVAPRDVVMAGRTQSFLGLCGIAVVMFFLARAAGLSRAWSLAVPAAAALWEPVHDLGMPMLQHVLAFRPDAPSVFFALAALALMLRPSPPGTARIMAALFLLMVSLWYKPTALGIAAAAAVWLASNLGPRRAAAWLAGFGATGMMMFHLADRAANGLLAFNLLRGNVQGFSPDFLLGQLSMPWKPSLWVMLGGAGLACAQVFIGKGPLRVLAVAASASFAVSIAMSFKDGADTNYFLLPFPLLAVFAGRFIAEQWSTASLRFLLLREPLIAVFLALAVFYPLRVLSDVSAELRTFARMRGPASVVGSVRRELRPPPGGHPLLLTSAPFMVLGMDGAPTIMDMYAYSTLAARGEIDTGPLRRRIRTGEFDAIVLVSDLFEERGWIRPGVLPYGYQGFLDDVTARYAPIPAEPPFYIMTPQRRAP